MSELSVLGRRLPKVNAWAHLTGTARYADDIFLPRMLYGRLLRSTQPHARIKRLDVSRALAHPGVVAIVTGADMPEKMGIMPSTQDETALAVDKVRYVGEPVAAVAALDEDTAYDALSLIDVDYEPLEAIFTIEEALGREDIRIHEGSRRANVFKEVHLAFGDLEGGFAAADLIRDDWSFFEGNTHAPIETHSCVASYEGDGKLTLWTATQVPHYVHRELEKVLGLPRSRIRVIATPNGGAFGGKSDPFGHEFAAALLSMRTRRPVKISLDREEVFYAHRGRHPVKMHLRTGVTNDGEITAVHFQSWLDGGAYASYGIATTYYTGALLTVTYRIPAYKFDGVRVYTNKPPCGPKRGHGTTQPRYAFECQLDKIATELGLDPIEYRLRVLQPANSRTVNDLRITTMGLGECLKAVRQATGWDAKREGLPRGKGIGVAGSAYISGARLPIYWTPMPHSGAEIRIDRGGGVTAICGTAGSWQGSANMLRSAAARDRPELQGRGRGTDAGVFVPGIGGGGVGRPRDGDAHGRQDHHRARLRPRPESGERRGPDRGLRIHGVRRDHGRGADLPRRIAQETVAARLQAADLARHPGARGDPRRDQRQRGTVRREGGGRGSAELGHPGHRERCLRRDRRPLRRDADHGREDPRRARQTRQPRRSEEHTSELQSHHDLV